MTLMVKQAAMHAAVRYPITRRCSTNWAERQCFEFMKRFASIQSFLTLELLARTVRVGPSHNSLAP
jgi:hypothetical protein